MQAPPDGYCSWTPPVSPSPARAARRWASTGYSKDYRPDLKQMILGLVVDGDGRPICTEMWPGDTADVTSLLAVVDRLRVRFSIGRVCVVADRGMISAATIAGLEERKLDYILGARERSDAIVRKIVLDDDDPFVPLLIERKAGAPQLFVKQVKVGGVRYIVCRNEAEAANDRKDREAIVAALDAQLKKGDKALIGNSAYRRYLRNAVAKGARSFEIDAGKLAEEARFDGIFVLRTNAKITPLQAVLAAAISSRSRTSSAGPRRSCAPGRSSIPPTPPSAAMSSARSWRSRCRSISTTSCARPASFRNGRTSCATSTASPKCASAIAAPTGWCAPTPLPPSSRCSRAPTSPCRPAPSGPTAAASPLEIRPNPTRPPQP